MATLGLPLVTAPFERLMAVASGATFGAALEEIRLIRGVKEDKERLMSMLERIKLLLVEGSQSGNALVDKWLDELSEVVYDAEDVLDEFAADAALLSKMKKYCPITLVRKLISEHNLSNQLKIIWSRLDDINPRKLGIGMEVYITNNPAPTPLRKPTGGSVPWKVDARENEKGKIMDWLSIDDDGDDNISFFSISGVGGMGKTTLAQYVYSDHRVKNSFEERMWVCVSNDFDIKRITEEMCPGGPSGADNLDALQRGVEGRVVGKKFLLVLDDIWNLSTNWKDVFNPLKSGKKGSKVLITTRSKLIAAEVTHAFGPENTLHLQGLPKEVVLSLLQDHAFGGKTMDSNMKSACVEISEKLGGSPLAAKTVGRLLNNNFDMQYWDAVAKTDIGKLKQQGEDDIMPVLRLSYVRLPPHLKECFAYCSLFPQDYRFERDELIQLLMAQGLVKPEEEMQTLDLEYWGGKHLDDLDSLSLFEQLDPEVIAEDESLGPGTYYVMHDLIHDMAVSVSQDRFVAMKGGDCRKGNFHKRVRHLSWRVSGDVTELGSDSANILHHDACIGLRSLHLEGRPQYMWSPNIINFTDSFLDRVVFSRLKRLRVLKLKDCPMRRLPSSIRRLKHLRFLELLGTNIEELPDDQSLGDLCNLQFLRIWGGKLTRLPQSLGKLCNLRRLDLSGTSIEELPEDVGNLCNLEVLKLQYCEKLKKLPDRVGDLTSLRYLDVVECRALGELPDSIGQLANLRHLGTYNDALLCTIAHPGGMTSLPYLRTVAHPRELKHMKELQSLTLGSLHLLTTSKEGASEAELHNKTKITRLQLSFEQLRGLDGDADAHGATHHDLDHHHKDAINHDEDVLEALQPHLAGIQRLEIAGYRGLRWPRWMVDSSIHRGFPSLEVLMFSNLHNFEGGCCWWETANYHGREEQPLPRLRYLNFIRCPMLRRLPPALPPALKELVIRDCPKLEWAASSSSSSLFISPPLDGKPQGGGHLLLSSSLVELDVEVLHGGGANGDDDPQVTQLLACLQGLRSLQKLCIRSAERMSEAATAHVSGTNINIATTVTDGMLLCSPGEELLQPLTSLGHLYISKCPLLTPFQSLEFSFNREPTRMAAEDHLPCYNNDNDNGNDRHPSLGGGSSSASSSSLLQLSSSSITTADPSSSSSQAREPQKVRRLEELTFRWIPGQMISRILRGIVSLMLPVLALRFEYCDELRSFGDDCEGAHELDVNSTAGGGIGPGESSELDQASLLDHLAPSLSRLEFIVCGNLQRLPPQLSCLSSLKVLTISYCDKIGSLPEAGLPPSLQQLAIRGCPKLRERCLDEAGADWPKICHIPYRDIPRWY